MRRQSQDICLSSETKNFSLRAPQQFLSAIAQETIGFLYFKKNYCYIYNHFFQWSLLWDQKTHLRISVFQHKIIDFSMIKMSLKLGNDGNTFYGSSRYRFCRLRAFNSFGSSRNHLQKWLSRISLSVSKGVTILKNGYIYMCWDLRATGGNAWIWSFF